LAELRRYYARQRADATRPARLAASREHHRCWPGGTSRGGV